MAPTSPQGWVYGVSCTATPPRQAFSNPGPLSLLLRLLHLPLQVQGAALPNTPLLDLYVDHAVADAGLQGVTRLHLIDAPHQRTIVAAGQDAVAAGYGGQRADCFQ